MILQLPIARGEDGLPVKQGVDDFIVAHGEPAFREWMERNLKPPAPPRRLEEYRVDLATIKLESVDSPGTVNLVRSPTGSGKSYSDLQAARKAGSSLSVVPSHKTARESESLMNQHGLMAAAYPELNKESCVRYEEARQALSWGLSASAAFCSRCPHESFCDYRAGMETASSIEHSICTHQRAAENLANIGEGKRFISIHEDAAKIVRPTKEVSGGLEDIARIARLAAEAVWYRPDQTARYFFNIMEEWAHRLADFLREAEKTEPVPLPTPAGNPPGIDLLLFQATEASHLHPDPAAMRICRAIAAGSLQEVVVRVDRRMFPGRPPVVSRVVQAVWQTTIPPGAVAWFSDATADATELSEMLGQPITDRTPAGRLEDVHPVLQVPLDVKKSTAAAKVAKILQGVLAAFPQYRRVGVVCDLKHVQTVQCSPELAEVTRQRIGKVGHYRGTQSRASNEWVEGTEGLDCLLCLGTPRVPASAIAARLVQRGNVAAASLDGQWSTDWWSGETESGRRVTVRGLAYRHWDWYFAHAAIVKAELHQAIGRARSILPEGLPCIVVSNEDLGLTLADTTVSPLAKMDVETLAAVQELSPVFLNSHLITPVFPLLLYRNTGDNPSRVSTSKIARKVGLKDSQTRAILTTLEAAGLLQRAGQRGGWIITPAGLTFLGATTP